MHISLFNQKNSGYTYPIINITSDKPKAAKLTYFLGVFKKITSFS